MGLTLSGLSGGSGLDTNNMISELMKAQRMPLDKLVRSKQSLEWKRDEYRTINTKLNSLSNAVFDNFGLKNTFFSKSVSSSSSAVSVSGGTYSSSSIKIGSVTQLAKAASATSEGLTKTDGTKITSVDSKQTLAELGVSNDPAAVDENGNVSGGFSFALSAVQQDGTTTTENFSFDPATATLANVLSALNSSSLGVNAFFDSSTGKLALSSKHTGADSAITEVQGAGGNYAFKQAFGFSGADTDGTIAANGQNAVLNLNGVDTEQSSNTFDVNGLSVTLNSTFAAGSGTSVNIGVTNDTDKMFDKIKNFITQYNEYVSYANGKVTEKANSDFKPLTSEERSAMTEKDIENWEAKAKTGILGRDGLVRGSIGSLRSNFYEVSSGASNPDMKLISSIGITTAKGAKDGQLVIDEKKLREALSKDAEGVYSLLKGDGSNNGILDKVRASAKQTISSIEERAGNSSKTNGQFALGKDLNRIGNEMTKISKRLVTVEQNYRNRFGAMDSAIQKMNAQMSKFASQLGG